MATINKNINLLTDFGFKRFFGTEQYKKNLIHFLNAFLSDHIGPVTDIAYRQTEQLGRGDRRYNIPTVVSIILVDFSVPELAGAGDYVQHVQLKDDRNNIFSEKIAFLLIDLTKFAARKQFEQLADDRQKLCYAIKNMWRLEENDIPEEYDIFHELYEECKLSKLTTMEKQEYGKSVLEYEDVKEAMEYHHRMGRTEGFEKGYGLGVEKGIQQGIEQGKQQLVRNMLAKGLDPAQVADLTGIDLQEVRAMTE